ncbi:MAG TPA: NAD(P)/FAD-dependent oxidoreductase [Terriglobia bacterium]|nr:NAD(P)/FAD-dependent oxidoreductase [Terriglobia bacterium]
MSTQHDIVIIGAGHNGLVTAFYLAKAGLKPLVLERRPVVGGAAITDEFHPGFKCSTLAHTAGPLAPVIVRDMQLERHGLEMIRPGVRVFAPSLDGPDGGALLLYDDAARSAESIAKFSKKDAEKFPEFQQTLASIAAVLGRVMAETPPSIDDPSARDLWRLLRTGKALRGLGQKDMYRLLRWGPMAVADLVGEWFETELLRATIAARGIFGAFLGPWSAGSSALLLMRAAADPHPAGSASCAKGGMGALTQAMAAAAVAAGARIRTDAAVSQIVVKDGRVAGVVLASGEETAAPTVISGADPRRTFLRLIDPVHLTPDFLGRVQNYRSMGTVAKVNLALDALPSLGASTMLIGRIHIGPEIDYLERAFDDSKYGSFSQQPVLDITIPSVTDSSLAPPGKHVMSIAVQFAPYKLKSGDWNSQRGALGDAVVRTLGAYAPDLPGLIQHRQVITPLDLEETYGITGGHIFHGELSLDQLFTMRPLLGWARYRTPIQGLYLCGSGTHPGNGLTGLSGLNSSREIVKDWKKSKRG